MIDHDIQRNFVDKTWLVFVIGSVSADGITPLFDIHSVKFLL